MAGLSEVLGSILTNNQSATFSAWYNGFSLQLFGALIAPFGLYSLIKSISANIVLALKNYEADVALYLQSIEGKTDEMEPNEDELDEDIKDEGMHL